MTARVIDFNAARRSPGSAQTPGHESAPVPMHRASATPPREPGISSIASVSSLDDKRAAGRRLADLQAAVARANRDRDHDRAEFFQACVDAEVRRAQKDARRLLAHLYDDGPDGTAA